MFIRSSLSLVCDNLIGSNWDWVVTCDPATQGEIFKKVVGEDKHGYAKTFDVGIKVLLSILKDVLWEEERAERIKIE